MPDEGGAAGDCRQVPVVRPVGPPPILRFLPC